MLIQMDARGHSPLTPNWKFQELDSKKSTAFAFVPSQRQIAETPCA